jgi:hypothetical protein
MHELPVVALGDTLTRIIVTLDKWKNLKVNVTEHIVTRVFSDTGRCIDHHHFKVYTPWIGEVRPNYSSDGYGAEMFVMGVVKERPSVYEEQLIERLKEIVEDNLALALSYKEKVLSTTRDYASTVDRTPWGEDTEFKHLDEDIDQ